MNYQLSLWWGLCVSLGVFVLGLVSGENILSNGFNDAIDWQTLDDGQKLSKETGKPLMLLIHKSWCGACKALKPQFAASKEIEDLSSSFVMVNTLDDEEPEGDVYKPDGGYIPRILFFAPSGELQKNVINENGSEQYKFYYPSTTDIVASMRRSLSAAEKSGGGGATKGSGQSDEL